MEGLLNIALDKPKEMGGGSAATNPEQVIARAFCPRALLHAAGIKRESPL